MSWPVRRWHDLLQSDIEGVVMRVPAAAVGHLPLYAHSINSRQKPRHLAVVALQTSFVRLSLPPSRFLLAAKPIPTYCMADEPYNQIVNQQLLSIGNRVCVRPSSWKIAAVLGPSLFVGLKND